MNDQIKAKWWAALVVCLVATGCGDSGAGSATTDATGIGVTSEPTTTESTTTERAIEEAGPASSDCPSAGQDGSTATGSEADSLTWTQVDPPGGVETVFDVLHDGRLLAIAEEADTTGSTLYTSSDGQRWDPLTTLPLTVLGADIGPDVWVVVGGQAESAVQTMGASTVPLRFPRATELVAQVSADDGQSWSELPVPVELDDRPFVYSSVGVDGLAVDGDTMLVLARANARVDPAGAVIEAGLATATDTIIPLFDESGISAWVGTEAGGEVVSIELDELGIDTAEYDDLLGGEPNTSLLVSIGGADFSIAELPLSETAFPIDLAHTPSGFTVTTVDPGQDFAEASFFSADGRQWTESEDAEVSILDVEGAWTLGMTRGFPPQVVQSFDCAANWNPLPTPPGAAQPGDGALRPSFAAVLWTDGAYRDCGGAYTHTEDGWTVTWLNPEQVEITRPDGSTLTHDFYGPPADDVIVDIFQTLWVVDPDGGRTMLEVTQVERGVAADAAGVQDLCAGTEWLAWSEDGSEWSWQTLTGVGSGPWGLYAGSDVVLLWAVPLSTPVERVFVSPIPG